MKRRDIKDSTIVENKINDPVRFLTFQIKSKRDAVRLVKKCRKDFK